MRGGKNLGREDFLKINVQRTQNLISSSLPMVYDMKTHKMVPKSSLGNKDISSEIAAFFDPFGTLLEVVLVEHMFVLR